MGHLCVPTTRNSAHVSISIQRGVARETGILPSGLIARIEHTPPRIFDINLIMGVN